MGTNQTIKKAEEKIENGLKEGTEVTSEIAEETAEAVKKTEKVLEKPVKKVHRYWHILGPGLTTGAADDDPSGIATYSQQGAKYGFQLLWLAPLTFPLMAIVQEMCARIGLVTGRGLAANIKKYFPKWVLYISTVLLLGANSFNIGADIGAMAKASQLLAPGLPFWLLAISFVVFSLLLQIFISYEKYARYLKYLALVLLVYVLTAFFIKDFPWLEVLKHGLVPSLDFSKSQFILITAILGTTISPYLFFWETSQEVEEEVLEGGKTIEERQGADTKEIRKMRIDVWSGMFFSNLVMFFIIAVCGATLFSQGISINTAADAASALKPLAGNYAALLFTLGIIGTGLLGIPVLAGSASYAISESFHWREGLHRRFRGAIYFYGVIIISMLIGLLLNFIGLDPIKALIYAAVLNGLVAPVILILVCLLSNNRQVMGSWANSPQIKFFGWLATIVMIISGAITIFVLL